MTKKEMVKTAFSILMFVFVGWLTMGDLIPLNGIDCKHGGISGNVTEPTPNSITPRGWAPGASVSASGPTSRSTTAGGLGSYKISGLLPGSYTLNATHGSYSGSSSATVTKNKWENNVNIHLY